MPLTMCCSWLSGFPNKHDLLLPTGCEMAAVDSAGSTLSLVWSSVQHPQFMLRVDSNIDESILVLILCNTGIWKMEIVDKKNLKEVFRYLSTCLQLFICASMWTRPFLTLRFFFSH